jgi:hypothetical protein
MMQSNHNQNQQPKTADQKLDELEAKLSKTEITSNRLGWLTSIFGVVITCLGVFQSCQVNQLNSKFEEEKYFTDSLFASIGYLKDDQSAPLALVALYSITDKDKEVKTFLTFVYSAAQKRPDLFNFLIELCKSQNDSNTDLEICKIILDNPELLQEYQDGVKAALAENVDEESGLSNFATQVYEQSQEEPSKDPLTPPPPGKDETIDQPLWMYLTKIEHSFKDGKDIEVIAKDGLLTVAERPNLLERGLEFNRYKVVNHTFQAATNVNLRTGAGTDNDVVTVLKEGQRIKVCNIKQIALQSKSEQAKGEDTIERTQEQASNNESSGAGGSTSLPPQGIWAEIVLVPEFDCPEETALQLTN